jgi:hypothetical protein
MSSVTWMLTAAGWLAILAGAAVTLLGLLLVAALFLGKAPVSGAGMFLVLTIGAGPLLLLAGIAIVISGFKLMAGYLWARTVLQVFCWISLVASIAWLLYRASEEREIHLVDVVRGSIFFVLTGVPAILLILLLRSEGVQRAISR